MSSSAAIGLLMLVGSYGSASDTTFHTYEFDCATGRAVQVQALSGLVNPSFLALCDNGLTLLAVNENETPDAAITMLHRDPDDSRKFFPHAVAPVGGGAPCHVAIAPNGKYAVTANYSGGSITIVPFHKDKSGFGTPSTLVFEGSGPVPGRQASPHAHFSSFTPDGKLLVVNDLGTDRLHTFPLDSLGFPCLEDMTDVILSPGEGPRHLVYDSAGRHAYLINEIGGTVTTLAYDSAGPSLAPVASISADPYQGAGSGDIHLSPDGRFLYASNRLKGDGIAVFAVNPADGSLSSVGYTATGIHPRNFAITPDGRWLLVACRDDNRIEVYSRDIVTGLLSPADHSIPCPRPVCILFL